MGCLYQLLTIATQVSIAKIIGQDKNNIRARCFCLLTGGGARLQ
jgi:hypothetical protein